MMAMAASSPVQSLKCSEASGETPSPLPRGSELSPLKDDDGPDRPLKRARITGIPVKKLACFQPQEVQVAIDCRGKTERAVLPRGAVEQIPFLHERLEALGEDASCLDLQLPSEVSREHGLDALKKFFNHIVNCHNGVESNLWQVIRDWRTSWFLKQPGDKNHSKECDADRNFTTSLDLLIIASSLQRKDLCKPVLEAVEQTLLAIPEHMKRLKNLATKDTCVSDMLAPAWQEWCCGAVQRMSSKWKPDLKIFHTMVAKGLGDILLSSNAEIISLLTFARASAKRLPPEFLESLAHHVVSRNDELDRIRSHADRDANAHFLLGRLKQDDLRLAVLNAAYPDTLPSPGVLRICNELEQKMFCQRLTETSSLCNAVSADVLKALIPRNVSVALGGLFAAIERSSLTDVLDDDVVEILQSHGAKSMWLQRMRKYIANPPADAALVEVHTTVCVRFLQKHFASFNAMDRWMLQSQAPLRVVVELCRRDGVHVNTPNAKGLVHRTFELVSGLVTKAKFDELKNVYHSSPLKQLFLQCLLEEGFLRKLHMATDDKVRQELHALEAASLGKMVVV